MEHNERYIHPAAHGRGAFWGVPARVALIIFTALVLLNGILLLCESDPAQWYATFFGKIFGIFG